MLHSAPTASSPITRHHWKEPGSPFLAPFLQVFVSITKIPPSVFLCRLNSPSSQPLPLGAVPSTELSEAQSVSNSLSTTQP